jgi:hypothetical protein
VKSCAPTAPDRPVPPGLLYLATASGPAVRSAIAAGQLGQIVTPDSGNRVVPGARWILDNGCFGGRWTPERWSHTLERHRATPGCLFAVVADVVADSQATFDMWARWWPAGMRRGYRVAYVAQDGCRFIPAGPKALFIGGSTKWKLGPEARALVGLAKSRGLWVHMGRVNSLKRLRYAEALGCDSVDGTFLTYGPDTNLPRLLRFLRQVNELRYLRQVYQQPSLWEVA